MRLEVYNAEVAALGPAQSMSSSAAKGGGGSFMKCLVNVATSEFGECALLLANQGIIIMEEMRYQTEERQAWGRQRWPLLVAARWWGDPRVTAGQWVRPPQGTASLDFPIYAATWYDNKELGYYNYITGGRDGGARIEGGGIRVGGAMCAGRFDGGNCVAAVIREPSNNSGGGG